MSCKIVYSTNSNRTILSISSLLQGLYPMYSKSGCNLTIEQIEAAIPPLDISNKDPTKEIENLNNSALPEFMTIIPIHTLYSSERRINVHDAPRCKNKVTKIREINKFNNEILINATVDFNQKYSKNLNKYYTENPNIIHMISIGLVHFVIY